MQMVSAAPLARAALFGFALIGGVIFPSHTATQLTAARAPPHRVKAAAPVPERSMMRACNLVPDEQDGRVVGVKLYGIRRGSFLNRLGLHNGDSLRTINGFSMANADDALEAYASLRRASRVSVVVVRAGQTITFEYQIVD